MKLLVVAVGQRLPDWADAACADFVKRFPPDLRLQVHAVKTEPRSKSQADVAALQAAEAQRIEAAIAAHASRGAHRVVMDERGHARSTAQLAQRLQAWKQRGDDVVFIIGGPDGLAAPLRESAAETLRLSDLTLPHAMARMVLVEALYRAYTLSVGHPYHRE